MTTYAVLVCKCFDNDTGIVTETQEPLVTEQAATKVNQLQANGTIYLRKVSSMARS
jgi:hypothetical protein